ncbi:MAG TPA: hypothetical protein PK874_04630 [Desulfobacteraceae bacterium]|nr:hypothetical protein [Desulfobacteraceae bacterium]HPJ67639.1 hypothetical protein [Desulfobacteraceae bacterium]HPQ29429.1 hypothetical protein [Desulfobacteraceae bacterium]
MDVFWQSLFGLLEKLGLLVVPLIAAYIGWRLSQKTYVRQLLVDSLKNKFDALREIKSVIGNIPPDLTKDGLIDRLSNDDDFQKSLTDRMVRLFGLRNELIPFITPEFVELIDSQLEPLYRIENGLYSFRPDKLQEFAIFADEAKLLVASIETELTEEFKKQLK